MLEYFSYKKVKKHQAEKKARNSQPSSPAVTTPIVAAPAPVLSKEDEHFLHRVVSDEGERPPLPTRPSQLPEAGDSTNNQSQMTVHDGRIDTEPEPEHSHRHGRRHSSKGKDRELEAEKTDDKDAKKGNRLSFLQKTFTKKSKKPDTKPVISADEAEAEKEDINKILEDLNMSAVNNRAFSLSTESQVLVQKFTVILKDLINGVPTAYDDLTHLLDSSQNTLEKNYEALPSFLQKLITSLPTKLTGSLAPELLAVATEAQGLNAAGASAAGGAGFGAAAKSFLTPSSLKDLVTKPGAVVSMLKAIMNALKLRWPAFMGTNVLLSLGLFVLLSFFWYCHKRGREERLKREAGAQTVDSEGRIIELDDDPMLDQAGPSRTETTPSERRRSRDREHLSAQSSAHDHGRRDSPRSDRERRDRDRPSSSRRSSGHHGDASSHRRRPKSKEYVDAGGRERKEERR